MNWEAIGAVGEIIGAVAVVVSLVYLAIQMRQSNRLAKRAAGQSVLTARSDFNRFISTDPELHKLFWVGLETPEELSEMEWRRFRSVFSSLARQCESIHFDRMEGLLDEDIIQSQTTSMKRWFSKRGAVKFFAELGDDFENSFIKEFVKSNDG